MNDAYPIVKVEGLSVYQGNYLALDDITFTLLAQTNTAIVGPNGAGKSTLVQAILDLIPRSSGSVEIFGRPVSRLGNLRHQLGYIPQNFIFDRTFPLSVGELVGLGWVGEQRKDKAVSITQALHRTDTYHLRNQAIGSLSGGQMKRVLLAYCLVMTRKLLVLDEAFAGVDAQGTADFYALLNELKQAEGWTVLQVSHDIDMVSHHCDRVLCLNRSIVCSGVPEIALSAQNLLATYGPGFSRYQHKH
ncbi:metal ABC transporter ATP-binding protein [Calothrix sp. 336/3]|uniref:metal ABC transporter ATP-binding protein n=1 Tax=Calothrix sp. 336/3 TaxID=1337936 RepID=UPI0004E306E8|nr:ABC transporter ATP-binding protein [Calothrix sp. 336/3]AKG21501.1 ABC transporter ATP-binding protein [Calothrix sp. 336/3]